VRLFAATFGEEMSKALWKWKFAELPGTFENIFLIRDEGGELCGHHSALPHTISYMGREITGVFRSDFMVRPDMQRMGVGGTLLKAMREIVDRRCAVAYALTNPRSTGLTAKNKPTHHQEAPIYWRVEKTAALLKGLGWGTGIPSLLARCTDFLLSIPYRLLELTPVGARHYTSKGVERFGKETAELAAAGRRDCGIYVKRDGSFLNWRYNRHPEAEYSISLLFERDGAGPVGYIVKAVQEFQGFRIGFIVDILTVPPRLRAARYLLSNSLRWFRKREVEVVSCIMTGKNAYTRALKSLGLARIPQRLLPHSLHLMIRINDPELDVEFAADPDNWIITWADSDLV